MKKSASHGASNAFKGIKKGTSATVDLNGVRNGLAKPILTKSGNDETGMARTIKGSKTIPQHKKLAMTGHT